MQINNPVFYKDVTITSGTSITSGIAIDATSDNSSYVIPIGCRVCGIEMPAAWTAANLTFQASTDGITYMDMYDDTGVEFSVSAAASRFIMLDPAAFQATSFLKIRSGTSATPVNQGATRTITLAIRQLS